MKNTNLVAELKKDHGRGASRRLRRTGRVPAIIYGSNKEATAIDLDHNTLYHALKRENFHTSILSIELNGSKESVLLRDFQMHAFRPEVLHIDFQRVSATEAIDIKIPLHFINEDIAHAVKIQAAHITHVLNEIEIRALAKDIPHFIEVNLAEIKAGQTIHISDLVLPKGVQSTTLLRGDDKAVVIAGGIAEVADAVDVVSVADIPALNEKNTNA